MDDPCDLNFWCCCFDGDFESVTRERNKGSRRKLIKKPDPISYSDSSNQNQGVNPLVVHDALPPSPQQVVRVESAKRLEAEPSSPSHNEDVFPTQPIASFVTDIGKRKLDRPEPELPNYSKLGQKVFAEDYIIRPEDILMDEKLDYLSILKFKNEAININTMRRIDLQQQQENDLVGGDPDAPKQPSPPADNNIEFQTLKQILVKVNSLNRNSMHFVLALFGDLNSPEEACERALETMIYKLKHEDLSVGSYTCYIETRPVSEFLHEFFPTAQFDDGDHVGLLFSVHHLSEDSFIFGGPSGFPTHEDAIQLQTIAAMNSITDVENDKDIENANDMLNYCYEICDILEDYKNRKRIVSRSNLVLKHIANVFRSTLGNEILPHLKSIDKGVKRKINLTLEILPICLYDDHPCPNELKDEFLLSPLKLDPINFYLEISPEESVIAFGRRFQRMIVSQTCPFAIDDCSLVIKFNKEVITSSEVGLLTKMNSLPRHSLIIDGLVKLKQTTLLFEEELPAVALPAAAPEAPQEDALPAAAEKDPFSARAPGNGGDEDEKFPAPDERNEEPAPPPIHVDDAAEQVPMEPPAPAVFPINLPRMESPQDYKPFNWPDNTIESRVFGNHVVPECEPVPYNDLTAFLGCVVKDETIKNEKLKTFWSEIDKVRGDDFNTKHTLPVELGFVFVHFERSKKEGVIGENFIDLLQKRVKRLVHHGVPFISYVEEGNSNAFMYDINFPLKNNRAQCAAFLLGFWCDPIVGIRMPMLHVIKNRRYFNLQAMDGPVIEFKKNIEMANRCRLSKRVEIKLRTDQVLEEMLLHLAEYMQKESCFKHDDRAGVLKINLIVITERVGFFDYSACSPEIGLRLLSKQNQRVELHVAESDFEDKPSFESILNRSVIAGFPLPCKVETLKWVEIPNVERLFFLKCIKGVVMKITPNHALPLRLPPD